MTSIMSETRSQCRTPSGGGSRASPRPLWPPREHGRLVLRKRRGTEASGAVLLSRPHTGRHPGGAERPSFWRRPGTRRCSGGTCAYDHLVEQPARPQSARSQRSRRPRSHTRVVALYDERTVMYAARPRAYITWISDIVGGGDLVGQVQRRQIGAALESDERDRVDAMRSRLQHLKVHQADAKVRLEDTDGPLRAGSGLQVDCESRDADAAPCPPATPPPAPCCALTVSASVRQRWKRNRSIARVTGAAPRRCTRSPAWRSSA